MYLPARGLCSLWRRWRSAIVGWFVPAYFIRAMARSHAKAAANGLPEALELLVVCVEAGLSLEDGIDRMTIELEHSNPQLAEELALTSADLKILPSREAALMKLAERVNVPSVRTVVTTLSQTMRYGTPLAQAMRVVAAEMRNDSRARNGRTRQSPSNADDAADDAVHHANDFPRRRRPRRAEDHGHLPAIGDGWDWYRTNLTTTSCCTVKCL